MDRQQLAHILRAACDVSGDPGVIVLGSQPILGTYDEDELARIWPTANSTNYLIWPMSGRREASGHAALPG